MVHRPVAVRPPAITAILFLMLILPGCGGSPTQPSGPPPTGATFTTTTLAFNSDVGDFMGKGESVTLTLQTAAFLPAVSRSGGYVSILVRPNDRPLGEWSLILTAPTGGTLGPGTYETARFETASTYGLDFGGDGGRCSRATGRIVIHAIAFGPQASSLQHLRASFDNRCASATAGLRGEIAILADPWR